MKRIASFEVNHDKLKPGMYTSRIDGDITTYDIRMVYPNAGTYIEPAAGHTFEHLFATYARNSRFADSIIYCGPMGCQTGFYFIQNALHGTVQHRFVDCAVRCRSIHGSILVLTASVFFCCHRRLRISACVLQRYLH